MNSNSGRGEAGASDSGGRFQTVQPLRDLESNWAVDLAKNLEDYLLKICSGEIHDNAHFSINFAEAALLLQGSIQVYSRKVEYLYSLVLHALEFVSQKRQTDHPEGVSDQPEETGSHAVPDEEDDHFWGLDDIPVDAKNSLDSTTCKDVQPNNFVKPPANLVVLEGDCVDATGDGSELESYLLATNDLYRDFILLDPCDAIAVNNFLKEEKAGKWQSSFGRGGSLTSKSRRRFQSPIGRSGGAHKSSAAKKQDTNLNLSPIDHGCKFNDHNSGDDHQTWNILDNNIDGFEMDGGGSEPGDFDESDESDDPWKPLNPHELGNLRVKPFKKVKSFKRQGINSTKRIPITTQFPVAKMHGTISAELSEVWEARRRASERQQESKSPPLYEKLRHSLVHGGRETFDAFCDPKDGNEDDEFDNGGLDFDPPDFDMPESQYEYGDEPLQPEKRDDGGVCFDNNDLFGNEGPNLQASLEDLCRSHLDALLASIAETEKQTELAARVSTWKQRIEKNLEEQDSRPPFDIHEYGDRVMEKLAVEADIANTKSFADVVRGQVKHDVARSFSALLQLVNNGNVEIQRDGTSNDLQCYTAVSPFYLRLLSHDKKHEKVQLRSSKKRAKSPTVRGCKSQLSPKFPLKLSKAGSIRCTPEGKRRRRSRLVEPVDLHSAG